MICSKCGYNIPDNFKFCPQCGKSFHVQILKTIFIERSKVRLAQLQHTPKILLSFFLLLVFVVGFAGNYMYQRSEFSPAGKLAKIQKQQASLLVWRLKIYDELKEHDDEWKLWGETLDNLGKGSERKFSGYDFSPVGALILNRELSASSFEFLAARLLSDANHVRTLTVPDELSKSHRNILRNALDDIRAGLLFRHEACEIMKNACERNNLTKDEFDEVNKVIEYSNTNFSEAMFSISSVQFEIAQQLQFIKD